jgi:hypothetical protein
MGEALSPFLMGANTLGFLAAAVFFLRFWRRTRDSLFIAFSTAFFLLAANQALVALSGIPREEQSPFYLLRLAAFSLLIIAIVRKNMTSRGPRR